MTSKDEAETTSSTAGTADSFDGGNGTDTRKRGETVLNCEGVNKKLYEAQVR